MNVTGIIFALGLPSALGILLFSIIVPAGIAGRVSLVTGYGLVGGLVLVTLLMRAADAIGLPLTVGYTSGVIAVTAGLLMAVKLFLPGREVADRYLAPERPPFASIEGLLAGLLLLLIAVRVISLGIEVYHRPLFPFDATMHWATKARVWFETAEIAPFVDNARWLTLGGEGVFTDHHPGYPATIPLIQVWMSLAKGGWSESLINLPWLLCLLGLGLAFYGQALQAGSSSVAALVFCYLLLSMPLVNTHVALAGYADLFLGACYCLAVMAFFNWSVNQQAWQGILAVLAALSCLLIKNEGFYWLLTLLPGVVAVFLPPRKALVFLTVGLVSLIVILAVFPRDLVIAGHSMETLNIYFRPAALAGIRDSLFVVDSWHLFGYMFLGLLTWAAIRAGSELKKFTGLAAVLFSALVLFLCLFLFTKYSAGAVRLTAVGRISLHLVPAFMFCCMLLWREVVAQQDEASSAN